MNVSKILKAAIPYVDEEMVEVGSGNPVIDENQKQINRLLGIGDDVFLKYSRDLYGDDPTKQKQSQSAIDEYLNTGDMVFAKYLNQPEKWPGIIDECQHRVNELMGISDEAFLQACKSKSTPDQTIDETQRKANELMGLDDVTFKKYNK